MRKIVLSIFAVLMFCFGAVAQGQRISGTVSDESGAPVLGATVSVVGTTTATITDIYGQYEIRADKKASLEFSFVGLETQIIAVGGRTTINVVMKSDAHQIEELVVVGYGSGVAAKSLVGSVSSVKGDKVADTPVANVADVLQGKIPGLQVFTSSGEPAAGSDMMMRGVSSFNASTSPLVILDGTPVSSSILNSINPNDIESVVMLKDAASTSIYGSRAANGVMYVTTKRGNAARTLVQIGMKTGFSAIVKNPSYQLMTSQEQIEFEEKVWPELTIKSPTAEKWLSRKRFVLENNYEFDWMNYAFGNDAPVRGLDASVTGAAQGINYYISASYLDTEGIAPASESTRYNFRTNIDAQVKKWFRFGANISLNYHEWDSTMTGWGNGSIDRLVYGMAPYLAPYEIIKNDDGSWRHGDELIYFDSEHGFVSEYYNPYYTLSKEPYANNSVGLNASIFEEIKPIEGLTLKAVQAIDASDTRNSAIVLPSYEPVLGNGQRSESFSRYYQLTSSNTAEYKFSLDDMHNWTLLAGHESIVANAESFGVGVVGIKDDRVIMMGAGDMEQVQLGGHSLVEEVFNSFFGRMSYNYDGKYYLDASLRTDGSSHFADGYRWGTFWSIGGMWNVKSEEFMLPYDYINDLRLKASYGTTGNSEIGNYMPYGTIGVGGQYDGSVGMGIGQASNEGITWETMKTTNIGVSARLFNRLTVEAEIYNRLTENMLMQVPYSATTGYSSGWGNVGRMVNGGVELQFNYDLVQAQNLLWSVYGNIAYNHNELLELYGDTTDIVDGLTGLRYSVGHSTSDFSLVRYAGVDPRDGAPMWYDIDGNLTKKYSDADAVWTGMSYMADWSGGFGTSLQWGNLQLMADFSWIGDRWMFINEKLMTESTYITTAGDAHFAKIMNTIWTEPGQETTIPRKGSQFVLDTSLFSNAAFLRLKNLTVSYNIPGNMFGNNSFIQGARVYAIARNLLTFTNFVGMDPEYLSNGTQGTYPNTRQYTFGLELSF